MNWLRNFMRGRNGSDQLGFGLLGVWLLLSLLLSFVPRSLAWLRLLTYIPLLLCLFRMLSKNVAQRQLENERFVIWWGNFSGAVKKKWARLQDSKTHKYIHCPNCKQTLRLPRGRGKLRVTCPKCSHVFERKT